MAPVEAVISGIGGAFPQSEGLEGFIDNLIDGKNLSTVDDLRWKPGLLGTSPHLGKVGNVHRFDNSLFKVHTPLARLMDPLCRLMLERSLEAILDAGLAPKDLENTYTSVFMTTTVSESESRTTSLMHSKKHAGYAIMAGSKTMMSNRISYCLNLNGPSVTLDGDWTVAQVAIQRAARSIESGESDFALIGAANTCLFPELNKIYEDMGILSSDGQCRSLDASGSGCFRSEGAVVFLLQRSDTANRVYARISGIKEMCMGTRKRFVGVDTLALAPLMESLYRESKIEVKDVKLLTSDGISIPEIEKDEMEASASVLCKDRSGLPVSGAKGVAGHGDAVGSLVSVIHAIASMERGVIPPLHHFEQPHPDATSIKSGKLQVVKTVQPLELDENSALGVNSIGYSGCIAHSIFKPNTKVKQPASEESKVFPRLITVSGRTEEDAVRVVNLIIDKPFDPEFIRLTQQAFSKPIIGYTCRASAIIPAEEPGMRPLVSSMDAKDKKDRPIWFVYSGMGSQWAGMGKGLLQLPIFAETIDRLQPILEPEGIDLRHTITSEDNDLFENIVNSFISIAAIQIGLTNVMRALGVEPDGIIGHSTGELGCAYGDGCLTEEETLRAAYARGRASLSVNLIKGMMASIGLGSEEARAAVPDTIDVACHNSADNSTISGPTDDLIAYVETLKEKNIFARTVNVSNIAFHSRYVKPAGAILQEFLFKVIKSPKKRTSRWVPTSLKPGDEANPKMAWAGPEFFTNNLLSPVRFEEAMRSVPKNAVVIELAPHGLMQPLIRRGLPEGAVTFSLTRRGHRDGLRFLLENVGKIFMECVSVKSWVLAPPVALPVSRGTACLNSLATWDHREQWPLVINTRSQVSRPRSVPMYPETTSSITQSGKRCAAPAELLEIVWREVAENKPITSCPVIFKDLEFTSAVDMNAEEHMELQLQRETGLFEMVITSEDWDSNICVLKGIVQVPQPTDLVGLVGFRSSSQETMVLEGEDIYSELQDQNLKYDEELKTLLRVGFNETETTGMCQWSGKWHRLIDSLFQLAALTDSQGSIFCGKIRKVTIVPQEMRAVSSALPVRHLVGTQILAAPGINIEGYRRSETTPNTSVNVLNLAVEPLKLNSRQELNEFLKSVALIRVQNSDTTQDFSVLALEEDKDDIATRLQKAISEVVGTQVMVRKVLVRKGSEIPAEVRGAVILVTDFRSNQVDRVLAHCALSASAHATPNGPMVLRCGLRGGLEGFVAVASNLSEEESHTLLVTRHQPAEDAVQVVQLKTDEAVPADLQVPAAGGEVILVWRGQPREGIFGAVASARGKPYGARARMVIIMDEDAPEFSLQKDTYKDRLSLGLTVNILQGGRWSEVQLSKFNDLPAIATKVEGYQTRFLGLNPSDLSSESPPSLGAYDYCGLREGTRVMGLARGPGGNGGMAIPDDILRWEVPAGWSDMEAATVPLAYSVAYHVLGVLAKVQPGQTVLVVDGTSPVSQACIRVAAGAGCTVITTAGSERQRKEVIALNPQVSPDLVFRHDKNTLKYFCMKATADRGLDVGLVPVNSLVSTIFDSLALNGRTFVMSRSNALLHHIGMEMFLKSAELISAGPDALMTTTTRDKKLVQSAVQNGIAAGTVRPLGAHVLESVEDVDVAALRTPVKQVLRARDAAGAPRTTNGTRAAGVAFAVAGGRADSLVTMARAAAAKGSTMVLAASRDCGSSGTPARARFVPALRQTTFVPFPKGQSDAKNFLSLASKADNIKSIVINIEDAADRTLTSLLNVVLPTVNGALKGVRLLVLTESLALGTETVEAWRRMGLPACAVVGDARQAAHLLPTLLTVSELPAAVLAYHEGSDCRVALGAPTYRAMRVEATDLPRASDRTFVELPSLSPRLRCRHNRLEPLPLFAVTGPNLAPRLIKQTASSLFSPVLVADGSQQTTEQLAQEILRLQPRGPWAILGDAECAPMVLDTARKLEKRAGRANWREFAYLALVENASKDADLNPADLASLNGPLHLIREYEGEFAKTSLLNEKKTRHFVSTSYQIATVLNNHLLSPLSKIISC